MTSEGKKPSEVVRDAVSGKQEANESKDQGAHAALDSAAHRSGGANEAPAVRGRGPLDPTRSVVRTRPLPAKPRRVRAGVKLSRAELDYHDSPTAARWLELAMATIKPAMREEALEYARSGQAKRLELGPGRVVAPIQGRMPGAYTTRLEFDTISAKQWDAVVDAMGAQAKFAATLIAGHLTGDLIKLFESLGSSLVPGAIRPSCTCAERRVAYEAANPVSTPPATASATAPASAPAAPVVPVLPADEGGWCKHTVCLAVLVADRLASEPLAILQLRGMPASEVMDRLHEIRTAQTQPGPPTPVYTPVVKGASDVTYPTLESCLSDFWSSPIDPRELDFPVVEPEVSHPLLRRLGPSPFQDGTFPLVGILASCYDSISEAILREEQGARIDELDEIDEIDEAGDEAGDEGGDESGDEAGDENADGSG